MAKKIIILGGGVAGLSAAHELAERGFSVTVYEQGAIPGGKARSLGVPGSAKEGRKPLPGEHGFRFFPGFYKHLPDEDVHSCHLDPDIVWYNDFAQNETSGWLPSQVMCHSGRILFTSGTAHGNKQDPCGMKVPYYSANKLPIERKSLTSYKIFMSVRTYTSCVEFQQKGPRRLPYRCPFYLSSCDGIESEDLFIFSIGRGAAPARSNSINSIWAHSNALPTKYTKSLFCVFRVFSGPKSNLTK